METSQYWRDVSGWEGVYAVSNTGRVKRLTKTGWGEAGRELKPVISTGGYPTVRFTFPGRTSARMLIHVMVINAFGPARPSASHEVNHINGVKSDNRIENLEWVTRAENIEHAFRLGLSKKRQGCESPNAKLSPEAVLEIMQRYENGQRPKAISEEVSVSVQIVRNILAGRTYVHTVKPKTPKTLRRSRTLDRDKVVGIKQMLAEGKYSAREIGEKFGVSGSAVQHIKMGRVWHDVHP